MLKRIPTALIAAGAVILAVIAFCLIFVSLFLPGVILAVVLLGAWIIFLRRRSRSWRVILTQLCIATAICLFLQFLSIAILDLIERWLVSPNEFLNPQWLGFVFIRLVVLLFSAMGIHVLFRSFPWIAASIIATLFLAVGAFSLVKSQSPDGMYGYVSELEPMNDAPDISPELYHKDHFWRFSHGKVEDCFGDLCSHYGRYEKTPDGWIVVHELQEPYTWKLQFSVFGYRLIMPEGGGATAFCPRRIVTFARPYWMPDWLQ
jgi:hypothetical protein